MQLLCPLTIALTLFTHATALVIQIDLGRAALGSNHDDNVAHLNHEFEHVRPGSSVIADSCMDDTRQQFMTPHKDDDDVFIQDLMCTGTPHVLPRRYDDKRIAETRDIGYNLIGTPLKYPHEFYRPLPPGLNAICDDADVVNVWTFPISNPGAPNPGPDRVIFATSKVNRKARPLLCGVVAHTDVDGNPATFRTCDRV